MKNTNNKVFLPLIVERPDISKLHDVMKSELYYYNSIVTAMQPAFLREYEIFLDINSDMIALYGSMCEMGITFDTIDIDNLPEKLKCYKNILESIKDDYKIKSIFNSAASMGYILPQIRKSMGREILKSYIEQSKNKKYKRQLKTLTPQNSNNKRHVQLKRKNVISEYDEDKKRSSVLTPYNNCKMYIENHDFSKMNNWNTAIIRQQPMLIGKKKVLTVNSPWVIFLTEEKTEYLIHFIDQIT